MYLDRNGVFWKLDIKEFRITVPDKIARGEIKATGKTPGQKRLLTLLAHFELGTDVRSEAARGWHPEVPEEWAE